MHKSIYLPGRDQLLHYALGEDLQEHRDIAATLPAVERNQLIYEALRHRASVRLLYPSYLNSE